MKDNLRNARGFSSDLSYDERMLIILYRLCDERGRQRVMSHARIEYEESKIISFPGSCLPGT